MLPSSARPSGRRRKTLTKLGALFLVFVAVAGAWAGEITIAFTNDLHAYVDNLRAWKSVLSGADLILDAGDTWEDTARGTKAPEAWATMEAMGELGYDAMVLGNHETYLGTQVLKEVIAAAPFPVLATNLRSDLPTQRWVLLQAGGLRVLVLGVMWDLVLRWPGWELLDPLESVQAALAEAPDHDLRILLAHVDLQRGKALAQALPELHLMILGHNHLALEQPIWVGSVPLVQAGAHGRTLGLVRMNKTGFVSYQLLSRPVGAVLIGAAPC